MGRPRGVRQGKRYSIYLRPDRLDRVGWDDPVGVIYDLIDELDLPEEKPEAKVANGTEEEEEEP